jgi:hypothetical protein
VDKYTVRKAGHEDRFEVLDLLKNLGLTVPPGAHKEEVNLHWDRLWKSNPSASNLNEEDGFIGHVLEYGAEIVGFFWKHPTVVLLSRRKCIGKHRESMGYQKAT